ncbi:hypothetical protein [Streptomyces sp. CBMA156]|uniref:hypothetical protein n=1 Tax=Streptomyces sp. CBMA156 TaxID=1930280 RepID=UPI0016620B28|nr:hypothetical protein [Streptomyces sp. CBMA156]MBD0673222.1 hypothetical protein [Streptomyces sp. CBMA156]
MQRWIILTVLTSALTGLTGAAVPAVAEDPAPFRATPSAAAAATRVTISSARIDPRLPGRIRVEVEYLCSVAAEARSLTVTGEQKDPADTSSIAFGSTRTAETDVLCNGTAQKRQAVVQSKTTNWLPNTDAVLTATVTDIGATPSAAADAKRIKLAGTTA